LDFFYNNIFKIKNKKRSGLIYLFFQKWWNYGSVFRILEKNDIWKFICGIKNIYIWFEYKEFNNLDIFLGFISQIYFNFFLNNEKIGKYFFKYKLIMKFYIYIYLFSENIYIYIIFRLIFRFGLFFKIFVHIYLNLNLINNSIKIIIIYGYLFRFSDKFCKYLIIFWAFRIFNKFIYIFLT